ncbi:Multidrug and toxin extrusion protein 1, partial [Nibea albiflora]
AAAAAPVQSSGCGAGLQRIRGCVPLDYRNEIVQLLKIAGPVITAQAMVFMINFVSMMFCGHLGKTELAGVSLAAVVVNIAGISIGTGLSSACDTLISQTYGSGNLKRVGVILQRAILILLLACFPCWAVLINTEALLLALRQSPEVASLSQLYVKIFMPGLPAAFIYMLQGKYLQNQGVAAGVLRGAGKQLIGALCNLVTVYFIGFPIGVSLMFAAKMGIVGLWIGLTISVILQATIFITVLCKLDWKKAAQEAFVRAGVRVTVEKEMVEVEHSDSNQSQAMVSATLPKSVSAEEDDADLEARDPSHSLQQFRTTTVGDVLSVKQLVLWRGLALLLMTFILIAGIVASDLLLELFK